MFEDDADADVLGLARAAQSVLARTRALDPARRIQALDALQQMVAAERLAATAEARRTEAFAETHQSLKTWIADLTHTDASVAKTWTALAGFEARLPGLASALASGAASLEHVRVAVRALRRVEDDDARAVDPVITEAAETCTPSELAQLLAHIKDQMAPEAVDDDAGAALDRNRLDVSTTFEGNVELSGHLEPTSGAIVSEAISAFSAPVTGADGRPDDRTPKQRRAAALVEICRRAMADRDPASRGGISQLLLLVDGRPLVDSDEPVDVVPEDPSRAAHPHHADYCAGGDACGGTPDSRLEAALLELLATACPEESERAEERAIQAAHLRLADPPADAGDDASGEAVWRPPRAGPLSAQSVDGRPVSRPALEHLSCDARVGLAVMPDTTAALLPRALRRGRHDPLWLGRSQRVIPASLRRALVLRDRGCVHPHCNRPASWCEAHHRIPWLYGGLTDLENTMLVCSYHHHWLHAHGMNLQRRVDGTWELVIDLLTRELRGGPASRPLAHSAT